MTTRKMIALALLLALLALAGAAAAQEPDGEAPDAAAGQRGHRAFTYQGRLVDDGNPAGGVYDFQFRLFDAAGGGSADRRHAIGGRRRRHRRAVHRHLDFGAGAFDGLARWLEIAVKRDADGGYTTLSPRVALTPAPHALALPGLWTQQNATSPNLIGGYAGNVVGTGVTGGTIAGGGSSGSMNHVYDNGGAVGGGAGNVVGIDDGNAANQNYATVSGGGSNTASGGYASIGGGEGNVAAAGHGTVGGGRYNSANDGGQRSLEEEETVQPVSMPSSAVVLHTAGERVLRCNRGRAT